LPLLEAADPRLDCSRRFRLRAIPVDTLRVVLQQPGLVTGVHLRPSHVSRMLAERSKLSRGEVRAAETIARASSEGAIAHDLRSVARRRQALVLDAAYDLFRYRVGFSRDQPGSVRAQEQRLLVARNQAGLEGPPRRPEVEISSLSPEHGHQTGRLALAYGLTNRSHFEEINLRPAVHDQDDPPLGFTPWSQLQMFTLRLRWDDDRRTAFLQQFTLVDLMSYSALDRWVKHPSWKVNTGLQVANDLNRDPENALVYGLNGGSGFSMKIPFIPQSLVYALADADLGVGHPFRDKYRAGGGPSGGIFVTPVAWWRLHLHAVYYNYPLGNPGETTKLQLIQSVPLGRDLEVRFNLERQNAYKEVLFSLQAYL
jgi:hypothetical protein